MDESRKSGKNVKEYNLEPIHLVLIEEPEAHLHAQVQQVFINKAYSVLRAHTDLGSNEMLHTQLVVSTHSSHVVHEMDFAWLRYFRRLPAGMSTTVPVSSVINLSEVFGDGTDTKRFVTRYLRAHHCDLFFADAAILVEGPAEKILIPNFIKHHHHYLTQCYISILEINGSHAHRLKPLIDALGLLTLVIADIDAGTSTGGQIVKARPSRGASQVSANTTLKTWAPKIEAIDELLNAPANIKKVDIDQLYSVMVSYQMPISVPKANGTGVEEALPSTFEDSLVMENIAFFAKIVGTGLMKKCSSATANVKGADALSQALFDALKDGRKAEFALDVLVEENFSSIRCPKYISDGLEWLVGRLKAKKVDVLTSGAA